MPNTILNDPTAANSAAPYAPQSRPDKGDVDAWVAAWAGTGVVSGCGVTATGGMNINVADGAVGFGGVGQTVTGTAGTIAGADGTNSRVDLVVATSGTGPQVITGSAGATPAWPTYDPATQVLLAAVTVPAGVSAITTAMILDKRVLLANSFLLPSLNTRQTATHTTASLIASGEELSSITLAKSYRVLSVTTSAIARVRLYDRAANQTADASRAVGSTPTGDHGLVFEFVGASGLLSIDANPAAIGSSMETVPTTSIPLTVDNLSGTTQAITVTFSFCALE